MVNNDADEVRHLELIQATTARLRAATPWLRAWAVTVVAGLVAAFSSQDQPRYAWVLLPVVAAFWAVDASLARQAALHERLARAVAGDGRAKVPRFSLDVAPFATDEPLARHALNPGVAAMYYPMAVMAALIAVYAPGLDEHDWPSEWVWYGLVAVAALAGLGLIVVNALLARARASHARAHAAPQQMAPAAAPLPPLAAGERLAPFPVVAAPVAEPAPRFAPPAPPAPPAPLAQPFPAAPAEPPAREARERGAPVPEPLMGKPDDVPMIADDVRLIEEKDEAPARTSTQTFGTPTS